LQLMDERQGDDCELDQRPGGELKDGRADQ